MPIMRVDRLNSCPVCRYSLRGLPAAHRCPECGFVYDENTVVWRPAKPWMGFVFVLVVTSSIGLRLLLYVSADLLNGNPLDIWIVVILCLLFFGCIYLGYRHYESIRRGRCVAITPQGVFVRVREVEALVPWSETISAVKTDLWFSYKWKDSFVTLKTNSKHGNIELDRIFSTEKERDCFIAMIETRVKALRRTHDR